MMSDPKPKSPLMKYAHLTGIAFQMMAVIFVFVWLGKWADDHYGFEKKYLTALGSLAGLSASLYLVLNQLKNIK